MKKKLLVFLVLLSVAINFVSAQCLPPTNVFVSNITNNSATVSWVPNTTTTTSDYNIQLMMNGTIAGNFAAQTSPYDLTGLPCGTTCTVQIFSVCAPNVVSGPSVLLTFMTPPCPPQFGQPQSMTSCVTNGFGCFNLASNTQNILANQPANLYTVSYHSSQADAVSGANPLVSPHCVNQGSYTVFSRVTEISSGNMMQVSGFTINAVDYQVMPALNPMVQCDDNNDQQVVFDLTSSQAVINTNNTLVYYPTLVAAQNQVNPLTPATNFVVPVSALSSTIFIREIIGDACDKIYPRTVFAQSNCNLASSCANANLLCNSLGVPFTNTISVASTGASGCLGSTPNPNWFYLPISTSGNINLVITQGNNAPSYNNQDVDYIIYGPFTSGT
ncbi:MAG: putative adhesin, partial [Bacteroidota bacterium]